MIALSLVSVAIYLIWESGGDARSKTEESAKTSKKVSLEQSRDSSIGSRSKWSISPKRNPDLPDFLFNLEEVIETRIPDLGNFNLEFDPDRLTELAANPPKRSFELEKLISLAASQKDSRFRYILDQENLRPRFDLALDAYDYAVNNNEVALDRILERRELEGQGSDSSAVVVLSYLDEWDRTIPEVIEHFANGADGAAGSCLYSFWKRRKLLFPESFERLLHPE